MGLANPPHNRGKEGKKQRSGLGRCACQRSVPYKRSIGTEHGAIGQPEADGAIEHTQSTLLTSRKHGTHHQAAIWSACFVVGWSHMNQTSDGIKL